MICASCGHIQSDGDHCQQCGSPIAAQDSVKSGTSQPPNPKRGVDPRTKEKYRPRPLHDLDLTISFPGAHLGGRKQDQGGPPNTILCTTTSIIEGQPIQDFLGVITSLHLLSSEDLERKSAGQKPNMTTDPMIQGCIEDLRHQTKQVKGDAVVGISFQIMQSPEGLWILCSGTAVRTRKT